MEKTALLCGANGGTIIIFYFTGGQMTSSSYHSDLDAATLALEHDGYFPCEDDLTDFGMMLFKKS